MKDRFSDQPSLFEGGGGENSSPQPPVPSSSTAPAPAILPGKLVNDPASEGLTSILADRLKSLRFVPACSNKACHAMQHYLFKGSAAEVKSRWEQVAGKELVHERTGHVFTGQYAYPTKRGWRVIAKGPDGSMRSFWWDDFN